MRRAGKDDIRLNAAKCVSCHTCVEGCPAGAMVLELAGGDAPAVASA